MSGKSDDGAGCAPLLAIVAIAIGVGCIWGAGAGWLTFGGILIAIILVSA